MLLQLCCLVFQFTYLALQRVLHVHELPLQASDFVLTVSVVQLIVVVALGNVIGANLFNLVLVSGVATTISPFAVPCEKVFMGYNSSLIIEIPLMLAVMLLMCIPALIKGKIYIKTLNLN